MTSLATETTQILNIIKDLPPQVASWKANESKAVC